ncbi:MAG: hypothetical protein AAF726_07195 [Planctomycetota bacterium]
MLAALSACATASLEPGPPVPEAASSAFLEAWTLGRQLSHGEDAAALEAALERAEEARVVAPGWAAPERFYDERWHRRRMTLPGRYATHLERANGGDASAAYLAGRLGGEGATARLQRAVKIDPSSAWGWHGLAYRSYLADDEGAAIDRGRRALALARDPAELALFSWALATYHRSIDDGESAREVLRSALAKEGPLELREAERLYIEAELAIAELEADDDADARRGVARALRILEDPGLTSLERRVLALRVRSVKAQQVATTEVDLAHAIAAAAATSDRVRASILGVLDAAREITAVLRVGLDPNGWRTKLPAAFGAPVTSGAAPAAIDAWLDDLPDVVKDADGLPLRPELRDIVEAVGVEASPTGVGPSDGRAARVAVGEALIAAGWFREARAWSAAIRELDPEEARELEIEALRGRAALGAVLGLVRRVDGREAFLTARGTGPTGETIEREKPVDSTAALESEIARLLGRVGAAEDDDASPIIRYGPLGTLVHPGQRFSAEDERLERGERGDEVPGLARAFRDLGRFALIGNAVGQGGPDATVLRILHVEELEGAHLGRPFRGTVFWCEGADVPGRFARRGAGISGAALHEGYYVDVEMVARDVRRWSALRQRFEGRPDAIDAALEISTSGSGAIDRTEITPALGAADRMRLAVMAGDADGELRRIHADDLAHVVAVHEEGHLCDRAQWYPLDPLRVLSLLGFAGSNGFSGTRIAEVLEERAQLVALCAARDTRLAWVDLLDAAEDSGPSVTPHAAAYARLLQSLVSRLESEVADGRWSAYDLVENVRWIDQIHRLPPEALRELAIREARARGLAADGS